ncbi:MAG: DNA polymerase III subunit gamma/tau, partial [Planctomycetota bacterium]|nr:DNA polymerase III subunit gamma/tau [Planctomycetota bacterium]
MSSPPSPSYQVVARRFRPVVFDDVVGQPAVLTTLKACLASERLPHAFLFCGSRGIGKTTTARILARAINCEAGLGPDPCGTCAACKGVLDGSANDVVELDAASNNGVDEVRAMREQAAYAPIRLRRKVFILDEAHMFSKSAFNALLKILEEPPAHVVFVLATTEPHKIPETVRSRCQVLTFRRIHNGDIKGRLERICAQEGVSIADEVLTDIAASAMGGLRDAETALERILPLADSLDLDGYRRLVGRLGPTRAADLVEACMRADARQALLYANEAFETGVDERECLGEVLQVLRHVFALLVDGSETLLVEASGEWRARLAAIAAATDLVRVDAMVQIVVLARERIRQLEDRRVLLELTLVRLARLGELVSVG